MSVWRAPEAEMPPELVAAMRRYAPEVTFPAPPSEPPPASTAPSPSQEAVRSPQLDWLLATLQAAMEGVMAGDATPLQKANAVARLAGHYMKAYGAKELERENKELTRRVSAAEARVAEAEARLAATAVRRAELPSVPLHPAEVSTGASSGSGSRPEANEGVGPLSVPAEMLMMVDAEETRASRRAIGAPPPLAATPGDRGHDPP